MRLNQIEDAEASLARAYELDPSLMNIACGLGAGKYK